MQKLLSFGIAGLAQIEEARVVHENRPFIENLKDIELRVAIKT
jgi:hypothetical protein